MKKTFLRVLAVLLAVAVIITATPLSGFVGLELPDISVPLLVKAEQLHGDIDADGYISARDVRHVLRYAFGLEAPTPEQTAAADIDNDEKITFSDARLGLRTAVGFDPIATPKLTDVADSISKVSKDSYSSLSVRMEENEVVVSVKLNHCVGLTAADMILSYNKDKLRYDSVEYGCDAEQCNNTRNNSFTKETLDDRMNGKIYQSFYFQESLWSSEDFAANAKNGKTISIDDESFETAVLYFYIINNAEIRESDIGIEVGIAEFNGSASYYDVSKTPAYTSVELQPDYSNNILYAKVILNNCVGLTSFDAAFFFDPYKLIYVDSFEGVDSEQVAYTMKNRFIHKCADDGNGELRLGGYFKESLWTSEQFAADSGGQTVDIDDVSFESCVLVFRIAEDAVIEASDISFNTSSAKIDEINVNLLNNMSEVKILCSHKGGKATCIQRAVCELCGEEYGEYAAHDLDIKTCVCVGKCKVCGQTGTEYAPHQGGVATCTEYAICDVCGQPYGELAEHTGGTATASTLAVCSVCGQSYGNFIPASPIDLRGEIRDNKCYVSVYFYNAVGLTSCDLNIGYYTDKLSFYRCEPGKDAKSCDKINGNSFTSSFNSTSSNAQIKYGAYFEDYLYSTAQFNESQYLEPKQNICGEDFEANVFVFNLDDDTVANGDTLTFTLTGKCKNISDHETECSDTLRLTVSEHRCHGGRATCQNHAKCVVCGENYGNYALHVDGNGDNKCDICSVFISDFEYTVLENGTVEITGYNGSEIDIVIPSEIDRKRVCAIGNCAFSNNDTIISVTIPEGVKSIGYEAFIGCSLLSSITIPEGVTSIGEASFQECTSITSITIPKSMVIIDSGAFYKCSSLASINIPNNVKSIRNYAFANCSALETISLPTDYCEIGVDAFNDTAYYNNEANWVNDLLYIDDYLVDYRYEKYLGSVDVISGTRIITDSVFSNIDGPTVTGINLPNSVEYIGRCALANNGLTELTVPTSVIYIGEYAIGYKSNSKGYMEKVDNFIIRGYIGSAAQKYANENDITFITLDAHTHSYTSKITAAPTCTKTGVRTFTCSCGKTYIESVKAKGHTPGAAATCTAAQICTVCKTVLTPAKGHTPSAWIVVKAASYTQSGIHVKKCTICAAEISREAIPMLVRETITPAAGVKVVKITADKIVTGISDKTTAADAVKLFEDSSKIEIRDAQGNKLDISDSQTLVGTGFTISIPGAGGKSVDTVTVMIKGDADSDGISSSSDARLALRRSVGLESFGGVFFTACDIDGSGVSSSDARLILRYAVGLEITLKK